MPSLLLILLAAALAAPAQARATLVFERGENSVRPSIWVAGDDGSGARRIAVGQTPALSPDGRLVAFLRWTGARLDLYVIPSGGGTARLLRRNAGWGGDLVWSPDSSRLAAVEGELTNTLVVLEVATGKRTPLAHGIISGFSFSPDGRSIAFGRSAKRESSSPVDVYAASVTGRSLRRLTHDGRSLYPLWGPRSIALDKQRPARYGVNFQVWLMNPDGGGARQLTHVKVPLLITGLVPRAWSRDGSRLLAEFGGQDTSDAFTIDPRTGAARDLRPPFGDGLTGFGLSADGRYVLAQTGGIDSGTPHSVVRIPYGGGRARVLARRASRPSWNL
jgi:Tol biopolymer transport system component